MLEKNGRSSMGKKSKNTKNRYLLITDKVNQEELEIRYNPTREMTADYQSKPQQRKLFRTMRDHMMNWPVDYNDDNECRKRNPLLLTNIEDGTKDG